MQRETVSEFCFCLFVCFSWKLAHCSVFCTRARNVAVVHLVRTGTQFIQVFSILSISSSVSLTHGAAHTLTHTFASSDTHNRYTWCCLAARLWLAIRELSTARVLKGVVICRQLQFTAMPCLWWKCPPGFSSVLELIVKKQHLKAS